MKIKTAHDLGFDAVEGLLHDRRLSRRILALAASRIQVSEGVLELMREGSREKQLLTALFLFEAEAADERDLERIGEHLDQASLEQLLVARALYIFPTECGAKGFTLSTPWSEIRKGLGFDLPLNVKVEDDSAPLESPPSTDNDDDVIDAQIVNKLVIISTAEESSTTKTYNPESMSWWKKKPLHRLAYCTTCRLSQTQMNSKKPSSHFLSP